MKLLHSIFIIFALVTEGLALECYSCSSSDGNCDDQKTCTVVGDEKCITRTVFSMESDAVPVQYYRGCSACSQSTSYKNGTHMVMEDCCSDMLCNGQNPRALQKKSALKCYSFSYKDRKVTLKEEQCTSGKDRCKDVAKPLEGVSNILLQKGCSSRQECVSATNQFIVKCCDTNLCNDKLTIPGSKKTSLTALQKKSALKCYSYSYTVNEITLKEGECTANDNYCIDLAHPVVGTSDIVLGKGCTSKELCDSATNDFIVNCCNSNLCNDKLTIPENNGASITGGGIFLSLLAALMGKVLY